MEHMNIIATKLLSAEGTPPLKSRRELDVFLDCLGTILAESDAYLVEYCLAQHEATLFFALKRGKHACTLVRKTMEELQRRSATMHRTYHVTHCQAHAPSAFLQQLQQAYEQLCTLPYGTYRSGLQDRRRSTKSSMDSPLSRSFLNLMFPCWSEHDILTPVRPSRGEKEIAPHASSTEGPWSFRALSGAV